VHVHTGLLEANRDEHTKRAHTLKGTTRITQGLCEGDCNRATHAVHAYDGHGKIMEGWGSALTRPKNGPVLAAAKIKELRTQAKANKGGGVARQQLHMTMHDPATRDPSRFKREGRRGAAPRCTNRSDARFTNRFSSERTASPRS
jgi:hypothetical protein